MLTSDGRLAQADTEAHPALAIFLAQFASYFLRSETRQTCERYLTGLLLEMPNKNCQTIAEVVPNTNQQNLREFLTKANWKEDEVNEERIHQLKKLKTEGDGVLVLDDVSHLKKGNESVGVGRQWSGCAGKVENCQVIVTCVYAERTVMWPIDTRVYLPKEWTEDKKRRKKVHIPMFITFQNKAQLALQLVKESIQYKVPFACVVGDSWYGENTGLLDSLEKLEKLYVFEVHKNMTVYPLGIETTGRAAEDTWSKSNEKGWQTVKWRTGSKGPLEAKFKWKRYQRKTESGEMSEGWLLMEITAEGHYEYYWSNFPKDATLKKVVEYAKRRHWIEQFHEEAKQELGWAEYQGRTWKGLLRHTVSVLMAYSFLVIEEVNQREERKKPGRPRRPFSPSAGSKESLSRIAQKASGG
jgi:SRSO17 transposase